MSLTKNKLRAARDLIRQRRYTEARHILATMDHPTAHEWLATLDDMTPHYQPTKTDLDWLDQTDIKARPKKTRKPRKPTTKSKRPVAKDEENDQSLITVILVGMILMLGTVAVGAIVATNDNIRRANISTTGDIAGNSSNFTNYSVNVKYLHSSMVPSAYAGRFCEGYVGDVPDHIIEWPYQGGRLRIRVTSSIDTVMLVLAPDGQWHCDDDGSGTHNPQVLFNDAPHGNYHIYVGPYIRGNAGAEATIYINRG